MSRSTVELESKGKLNKKKKRGRKKPTSNKNPNHWTLWKLGCSYISVPKAAVGRAQSGKSLFWDKGCSLHAHKEVSFFSYSMKKKAPKIKVKKFLMQIKNPFIFKKKCRDYSRNKLFWTSPLAHICSVRWNHWCQSTNSKAGKSRQWQPLSQNFRENFARAIRLEFWAVTRLSAEQNW